MKHPYLNYLLVETFRDSFATRFPLGITAKQMMSQGSRQIVKRHPSAPVMQRLTDTTERIKHALTEKKGLSVVSLGDSEVLALSLGVTINEAQFRAYLSAPARKKAGHTSDLRRDRRFLLQGLRQADVIGVPFMMHAELQPLALKTLPRLLPSSQTREFTDSAFGYLWGANGEWSRLLQHHPKMKVLLIGNRAPDLAKKMDGVYIVDCIAPVNGLTNLDNVLTKINRRSFDLALVAAGTASLPIAGHISQQLHRVAIDMGKLPDLLLGGWFDWLSPAPAWQFNNPPSRLMFMALWSQFMYHYFPMNASIPLGFSPGQILNAEAACHVPETVSYQDFVEQLNCCYTQKQGFVYLSADPSTSPLPHNQRQYPKHTYIGIPLWKRMTDGQSLNLPHESPRWHYVDSYVFSFTSSQFHPKWQDFLLRQKPSPRLLLIGSRRTKRWQEDLKKYGVRTLDTIIMKPKQPLAALYRQLQQRSNRFDVVIVSHGRQTVPICLHIAKRLHKIAIDGRELEKIGLKDYIHRLFWEGRTFRPAKRWQDLANITMNVQSKTRSD